MQMAQFGQMDPLIQRRISTFLETKKKRLSDQVMSEKMLALYKSKVKSTVKELNYQEFVAASYGEFLGNDYSLSVRIYLIACLKFKVPSREP
jgi:trigger factor